MVDPIPLHIAITYQPHINTNTMDSNMPNNTTISDDGHDEVNDVRTTPTDAQTLAWLVREVKELRRMLLAHSYPYQRATGGAIDIDKPGAHARRWGK